MSFTIFLMLGFYGSYIEGKNSTEYRLQPQITGQACKPTDAIGTIIAQSYFVCAYQCFQHPGCVSFFYSNMTMTCDRCSKTYDVSDDVISVVEGSSVYYSMKAEEVAEQTTVAIQTTFAKQTTVAQAFDDQKFMYVGCYSNTCFYAARGGGDTACASTHIESNVDALTIEKCSELCKQYSRLISLRLSGCYCDMDYQTPALDSTSCDHPCEGNQHQKCGGVSTQSIYTSL